MKKISIAIALLAAASCTYPFNPETPALEERVVIEGDILIGDETSVEVSYLMALDDEETPKRPNVKVDVLDSDGGLYEGTALEKGKASVDTRTAPRDRRYRLRVKNIDTEKTYYSEWQDVQSAPEIDSLSYIISDDRTQMHMTISLTAMESQKYYRWTFYEEWEYHSYHRAMCYCIPGDRNSSNPRDTVATLVDSVDYHYYCWNDAHSDGILLGTVEGLSESKLVNHKFATIGNRETKVSSFYRMTVTLQAIDQRGYDYWKNLDVISNLSGSFDSPNPNEMPGNLYCEEDPSEYVIGYVNVSGVTKARRNINMEELKLYDDSEDRWQGEIVEVNPEKWNIYYCDKFYRPISYFPFPEPTYYWAYARCVDCTFKGGSPEKRPADWPTKHY